jgi:hypothetical protein
MRPQRAPSDWADDQLPSDLLAGSRRRGPLHFRAVPADAVPARPGPLRAVPDPAPAPPAQPQPARPQPLRRRARSAPVILRRSASGSRPDRIVLYAVFLGLFLVLMSVLTGRADAMSYGTLGKRTLTTGSVGPDVKTLQRLLRRRGYRSVRSDGRFGRKTRRAVKRFQRKRGLRRDGKVGPRTVWYLSRGWRARRATYYGPGLYGRRTACGRRLTRRIRGVAHRTLRCGRRIPVYYRGRIMILPVIDRGPFVRGIHLDLTSGAARALRMRATTRVRAGY